MDRAQVLFPTYNIQRGYCMTVKIINKTNRIQVQIGSQREREGEGGERG